VRVFARRVVWVAMCVWFVPLFIAISFVFEDQEPLRNLLRSWPKGDCQVKQ
jgi:hypothetical protein